MASHKAMCGMRRMLRKLFKCFSRKMPCSLPAPYLLNLPFEMRLAIFEQVFSGTAIFLRGRWLAIPADDYKALLDQHASTAHCIPSILQTCRQLREEALPIFTTIAQVLSCESGTPKPAKLLKFPKHIFATTRSIQLLSTESTLLSPHLFPCLERIDVHMGPIQLLFPIKVRHITNIIDKRCAASIINAIKGDIWLSANLEELIKHAKRRYRLVFHVEVHARRPEMGVDYKRWVSIMYVEGSYDFRRGKMIRKYPHETWGLGSYRVWGLT